MQAHSPGPAAGTLTFPRSTRQKGGLWSPEPAPREGPPWLPKQSRKPPRTWDAAALAKTFRRTRKGWRGTLKALQHRPLPLTASGGLPCLLMPHAPRVFLGAFDTRSRKMALLVRSRRPGVSSCPNHGKAQDAGSAGGGGENPTAQESCC